jgi:hypothetical protein
MHGSEERVLPLPRSVCNCASLNYIWVRAFCIRVRVGGGQNGGDDGDNSDLDMPQSGGGQHVYKPASVAHALPEVCGD